MSPETIEILVDADACPVKDEVMRVALRHQLPVHFVSNSWMRLPGGPLVHRVLVPEGPDIADDWIAARATPRSIVVTSDIPLAARAIKAGAQALPPNGPPFTERNIGDVLATRNLMAHLREIGAASTHNASFAALDRSRFLQHLEQLVQAAKRR